jgi:hypothetical protein
MLLFRFRQNWQAKEVQTKPAEHAGDIMVTPEQLARSACDDQEWKQIEMRAASECRARCFRAAINILNGEIAKLPPNALEGAREQIQKRLGRDRLQRLLPFLQHDDIHGVSRLG